MKHIIERTPMKFSLENCSIKTFPEKNHCTVVKRDDGSLVRYDFCKDSPLFSFPLISRQESATLYSYDTSVLSPDNHQSLISTLIICSHYSLCSYNVWFMIMTYFLPMISMCYTYSRYERIYSGFIIF